jgi:transcriptional regulator with XRE-family HTH domain
LSREVSAAKRWGRWLGARREKLGMTVRALATATGIDPDQIVAYEGGRAPREKNRQALVHALRDVPKAAVPPEADLARRVGEVVRLPGSCEARATVLVNWRDANGDLLAIAERDDDHPVTIRTSVAPSTPDDVRSLRAVVDDVSEQVWKRKR